MWKELFIKISPFLYSAVSLLSSCFLVYSTGYKFGFDVKIFHTISRTAVVAVQIV